MRGYDPYGQYKKTKIETSTPAELVSLLYDEAIKCCKLAVRAIAANSLDAAHTHLVKAQDIVDELSLSIDKEKGGEIADNLIALYDYMKNRLVEANIKKDAEIVDEVCVLIVDLRETWQEAIKQGVKSND